MNDKKWFVLIGEKVQGPYRAAEVLNEIERGHWIGCRFWAKGKPHWMILPQFQTELHKEKNGATDAQKEEPLWFIREAGAEQGPLTFPKLFEYLKSKSNFKNILVASGVEKEWQEVYQVDSLMERLGVNRRAHPRVPIEGTLTIQDGFLRGQKFGLTTLSQGGLGAKNLAGLSIGEKFKGSFMSASLSMPIRFQAEVVFLSPEGVLGVKFINLSTEALSLIITYVRQFVLAHPDIDFQKIA
jgi:hypothetical protein